MGTIIAPGVAWGNRLLSSRAPFSQAAAARPGLKKIMVVLTDGEQTTEGEGDSIGCERRQNSTVPFSFDPSVFKLKGRALSTNGPRDQFSPYGFILDSDPFGSSLSTWDDVRRDLTDVSLDACNKAKQANVEIYTIAVGQDAGPGTAIHGLLQGCATDAEHMFYAGNAAGLEAAFDAIGQHVINIYLSR
jgi:hypothetical protein